MIPALAIIILALAWLALETDWLRVRLLAGPAAVWVLDAETRAAWDTFDWRGWSGIVEPICGWEWIKQRNHIIPEYRIEFNVYGCRYIWTLEATPAAAKLLGEAMKLNAKPHKMPKLPSSGIRKSRVSRRRRVAVAVG